MSNHLSLESKLNLLFKLGEFRLKKYFLGLENREVPEIDHLEITIAYKIILNNKEQLSKKSYDYFFK